MNILLLSAGRRTSLLKAFRDAAIETGNEIIAADIDPLAPALYLADKTAFLTQNTNPAYVEQLWGIIKAHNIGLVVPAIDTELPVLAHIAPDLESNGCKALVSSEQVINACGDKWLTFKVLSSQGISVPMSWLPGSIDHASIPDNLVVKPRNGSASQHVHKVHKDMLDTALKFVPDPIIQEELHGPEITIDALLDFDGQPVHYVPRRRLKTIGGESMEGVTIADGELRPWILNILALLGRAGGRGPMTLQAFLTDSGPVLTEVNPRFGGGFPLAYAAGGLYPQWIVQTLTGGVVPPLEIGNYKAGLYMTRYYVEHFTEEPLWPL
ncbi:MAG: ATP-grasp domain-containing protein [Armatimonadota bacterium]